MATPAPLLITQDDGLAEEVARLAAVAGCELHRRAEPTGAGGHWRDAALVLLDGPATAAAVSAGMPRRPATLVLARGSVEHLWRPAFEVGAEAVLDLPSEEARLVELFTEVVDDSAARAGRVLAVLGGTGGAGASTLAAATAITAARRGDRALLLDCDPLGGGLDLTVGVERSAGLRWSGLTISGGRVASGALHEALPGRRIGTGTLTVLSCDRSGPSTGLTAPSVHAVLGAGRRSGETVVCDLPRSLADPASAVLRTADLTIVLVPAQVRACAAAASSVAMLRERSSGPVRAVVRGPAPGGLRVRDIERAVGVEVLAVLRGQPGLASAVDRAGLCAARMRPRGSIARTADEVLGVLDSQEVPQAVAS